MISMLRSFLVNPRVVVLSLVWTVPCLAYIVLGLFALYQTGWLIILAWLLPLNWLVAWLIGAYWKPTAQKQHQARQPIVAPDFWTSRDQQAVAIVETYRSAIPNVDDTSIIDPQRYITDAQQLSQLLAAHYYGKGESEAFHPVTIVEILAVIHLAVEDLEAWTRDTFPGSELATIGNLARLPGLTKHVTQLSNFAYFASLVFQPLKILVYPLYRKSGAVATELRREIANSIYQKYLQQAGFYLIEMYSGRLRAGSQSYKEQFGHLIKAIHHAKGDRAIFDQLQPESLSIALLGQVKAGKSSLTNTLLARQQATTSLLPETRQVNRYCFEVPGSATAITLLDTPGYSQADVTPLQLAEIAKGVESADLVLLVMAANNPAKQSDVQLLCQLQEHYRKRPHLKPPKVLGVLTHIDLLRPVRDGGPPYDWRNPKSEKEQSIADAIAYCRKIFGERIVDYVALCTKPGVDTTHQIEELLSMIIDRSREGQSVALVRAYYDRFSRSRLERLVDQFGNLIKRTLASKR